jgi:hypothetical protein
LLIHSSDSSHITHSLSLTLFIHSHSFILSFILFHSLSFTHSLSLILFHSFSFTHSLSFILFHSLFHSLSFSKIDKGDKRRRIQ